MPKVKWSAELDQVLLVKVLEACDVKPNMKDFQNMADTWPANFEKPTPRAISEHLWKIRAEAKKTMNKENGDNSSPDKAGAKKAETTKKTTAKAAKKTTAKEGAGNKRKRTDGDGHDDEDSDDGVQLAVKVSESDEENPAIQLKPAKKARGPKNTRNVAVRGSPVASFEGKVEMEEF